MAEQTSTGYFQNPYKFNGKELDEETGLYYYGARYYDPRGSLWLSVDPMTEKVPMWNPYAYSYDNPVVFIDVDGNLPWSMLVKGFSSAKPSPPTMGRVHPTLGRIRPHHGIDMPATKGTPIFAAAEGTVLSAGSKSGYGNTIVIDHGNGYFTLYAHIQEGGIGVKVGQKIKDGQKIGEVGMTGGVSSGNHLHVEFIKIDDPNKIFMKGKEKSRFNPMEIQDLQNIITGREKSDVTFVDGHTEEVGSVDNLMKLSNSSVDELSFSQGRELRLSEKMQRSRIPLIKTLGDIIKGLNF